MEKFSIVKFVEENDAVQVVPSKWIHSDGEYCYWPLSDARIHKQIKKAVEPDSTWKSLKCGLIKEYESYAEAHSMVSEALKTSDLDTSVSKSRKKSRGRKSVSKLPDFPSSQHQVESTNQSSANESTSSQPIPSTSSSGFEGFPVHQETGLFDAHAKIDPPFQDLSSLQINEEAFENGGQVNDELQTLEVNECAAVVISNREHEAHVIRELALIRATLAQHGEILEALLQRKNLDSDASNKNADMQALLSKFQFPLKSCNQVQDFDEFAQTEEGLSLCVRFLAGSGGSNVEDAVQRILSKLFSDEILSSHSLKGKRNKSALITLTGVVSIIKESVKTNAALNHLKLLGKLDDDSVYKGISLALKKACDRLTQKQRRENNLNGGS